MSYPLEGPVIAHVEAASVDPVYTVNGTNSQFSFSFLDRIICQVEPVSYPLEGPVVVHVEAASVDPVYTVNGTNSQFSFSFLVSKCCYIFKQSTSCISIYSVAVFFLFVCLSLFWFYFFGLFVLFCFVLFGVFCFVFLFCFVKSPQTCQNLKKLSHLFVSSKC